jgi:regulator of replication initiation timing
MVMGRLWKMKQLIVKSNRLIEAKYKLTINEQRILLYVLSELVKKDDREFGVYKFNAYDLRQHFGRGMENFDRIVDTIYRLRNRKILIKDGVEEINADWVSVSIIDRETRDITIEFPQLMKKYLLQLKESFTSYQLENVVYLKSSYSVRLYELLKQYLGIKKRTFYIEELKEILCIPNDQYVQYSHFRDKILEVCKKQINQNSDIHYDYEAIKQGRRYRIIKFTISSQPIRREQQLPTLETPPFEQHDLFDSLIKYGCSPSESEKYIKKYPKELIERNVKYCIEEDENGKVDNKRGYIKSALDRDFAFESSVSKSKKEQFKEDKIRNDNLIRMWKDGDHSKETEDEIEKFYKNVGHPIYKNWRSFV